MLIRSKTLHAERKIIDEAITKESEITEAKVISEDVSLGDFCLCCSSGIQCSNGLNINIEEPSDNNPVISIK